MAWDVMSRVTKKAWDVMSRVTKTAWDVLSGVTKSVWDVLSGVANLSGMFCPGWQKMAWDFCPAPLPCSIGDVGPTLVCTNNESRLTLTYFMARSNLIPNAFLWRKS